MQSIPKQTFPGGALIGCSAGFLNVPKIKGSHNAMKTGMLAAEAAFEALKSGDEGNGVLEAYPEAFKKSWVYSELHKARNFRPAFAKWGLWGSLAYGGLDLKLLGGKAPWTFPPHPRGSHAPEAGRQHAQNRLSQARRHLDLRSFVLRLYFLTPITRKISRYTWCCARRRWRSITTSPLYDAPEQRYCPAGVYEIVRDDDGSNPRLQINAQNCVHCKTCDIKDPTQNINWTTPEGSGGPNYPNM